MILKNSSLLFLVLSGLFFYVLTSFSSELYFLCGPDEDGCFDDDYSSCACIPFDHSPESPHCLDFIKLWCIPLSDLSFCAPKLIYKDQGSCLATIFHSTPRSPCYVKTRMFCLEHHIAFCDHNGEPNNCHTSP